jgi:CubicO group peptidase (beta-lactamase class C family)
MTSSSRTARANAGARIRYEDGSFYRFPEWRWSFSHWRELQPTIQIPRGAYPVWHLPRAEREDLDAVTFMPLEASVRMTWAESLDANYTDGIVVLHRGRIVYERYLGALAEEGEHIAFSVTKSFFGTLAAILVAEGRIDRSTPVAHFVPELEGSGFGDATVGQVLDMTTAIDFVENYVGESPTMIRYRYATGFMKRPPDHEGPRSIHEFLPTVGKSGAHGPEFHYRTPNVDVMAWIIARATGESPATLLAERLWGPLGPEASACIQVDRERTPMAGSALNARLRDLARFGEMMRLGGRADGRQVVPASVVDGIRRGASREAFLASGYARLAGWSYRDFWWVTHDDHGAYLARGIHGQVIYIDPVAEMVIARFASHVSPTNMNIDPTSLPAYRAIADWLMENPQGS